MSVERLNIYTCDRCGHQEKVRRAITAGKERHPAGWARMTLDYIDGPGLAQWAVCITCRIERWPAVYQRVGMADQLARPGGWRHWSLPGSRCEGLVPR